MKYMIVAVLTIAAAVLLRLKKEFRGFVLAGFVIVMILLSFVYNMRVLSSIVPFYFPTNQTFYQTEFLEKGEYPDSFLPLLLKGKTVYTKDDRVPLDQAVAEGKNFVYAYYHNENAINYMELMEATVIPDPGLNDAKVSEAQMEAFGDLGYANDMFRYSFLLNDFWEEIGNYFTYYWYYSDYLPEIHVYLNAQGMEEADTLVVLWDGNAEKEAENLYIMTEAYYESEVAADL
ncbi:MAG: hypothetical protein QM697_01225 [Lachnospiraceae bacterium]